MSRTLTVVEVQKQVFNEEGKPLDVNNHVFNPAGAEAQLTPELYYLLHWGLETNFTYDKDRNPIPYTSTVGICQHIKTGMIETFYPGALKVIGKETR
jgi:hypothetical protein